MQWAFREERGLWLLWAGRGLGGKGGVWLVLKAGGFRTDLGEKRLAQGKVPCKCPLLLLLMI